MQKPTFSELQDMALAIFDEGKLMTVAETAEALHVSRPKANDILRRLFLLHKVERVMKKGCYTYGHSPGTHCPDNFEAMMFDMAMAARRFDHERTKEN